MPRGVLRGALCPCSGRKSGLPAAVVPGDVLGSLLRSLENQHKGLYSAMV